MFSFHWSCFTLSKFEQGLNIFCHIFRLALWSIVSDHVTISINEELTKVPWDVTTIKIWVLSQIFEDRISFVTVNLNLFHYWPSSIVLILELFDLWRGARLLITKLITRIGNDLKSFIFELIIKLLQAFVVLISESSVWCHVNHNYCWFILTKVSHLADIDIIYCLAR